MLKDHAIHAADMLEKGREQFIAGDMNGAEKNLTEALTSLNELTSLIFLGLGNIAYNRTEFNLSLEYLERARDADPSLVDAYCLTAAIYFDFGEMERAKEWCEKTLEINWNYLHAHNILAKILFPGPDYYKIMEMIHDYLHPKTYLEIGVATGDTLRLALDDTIAIGVDPAPSVDVPLGRLTRVYEKTSDDFFKEIDLLEQFNGQPIDLAFIDGMHLFDFALRDFINIESYCTDKSVVLVHDCCPLNDFTASRERISNFWSGDIWKLIVCLKKYRPDLSINVIKTSPTGLAIIRGLDNRSHILADNLEKIIEEFINLDYEYLEKDKERILNLVPNDLDVIKRIIS